MEEMNRTMFFLNSSLVKLGKKPRSHGNPLEVKKFVIVLCFL